MDCGFFGAQSVFDMDARDRIAAAGEGAADLVVADLARHLDDGVIAVQVDARSSAVDRVECLLDACLAVTAGHALDIDDLRRDNGACEFLFRDFDIPASAAAAFPTEMLEHALDGEEEREEDDDADDCCSHDGFPPYNNVIENKLHYYLYTSWGYLSSLTVSR